MKKKIIVICLFLLSSLIFGFGPPAPYFYIKNNTGERIYLQYILQEYLIRNFTEEAKLLYGRIDKILEVDEVFYVETPFSAVYGNVGYEPWEISVEAFMSLFQTFTVTNYNNDYISLYGDDMKQEYIKYPERLPIRKNGRNSTGYYYMLEIPRSAFYPVVSTN